ncbi:hypothetical protein D3C71_2023060 [compost metagenome]
MTACSSVKLTLVSMTPSITFNPFSTRLAQEEQVIPFIDTVTFFTSRSPSIPLETHHTCKELDCELGNPNASSK